MTKKRDKVEIGSGGRYLKFFGIPAIICAIGILIILLYYVYRIT